MTKATKTKEILTPIYVVAYRMEGISGNNIFFAGDTSYIVPLAKPDKFGVQCRLQGGPKEFTREQSIARAKELEAAGKRVYAYHYGFKQRGFQPGEVKCETAYQSPNWFK